MQDWENMESARARVPQHVVHRAFASETVLLNVETGHYYGMDAIGARFLHVLGESPDLRAALATLAAEYEGSVEQIRDDLVRFCQELLALGLLEIEEAHREAQR